MNDDHVSGQVDGIEGTGKERSTMKLLETLDSDE